MHQYPAWRTRREIEGEHRVRETVPVQARSALFDVYGDHLRRRGGVAPVAALIRLLGAVDIAPPAVRTAVSRMVRQGWLAPVPTADGPGYQVTERAARRLDDAYARIYRTDTTTWDGHWHLLVADRPADPQRPGAARRRPGLPRLRRAAGGTWLAARPHADAGSVLAAEGVRAETFVAAYDGAGLALAGRAWDLAGAGRGVRAVRGGGAATLLAGAGGRRPGPGGLRDPHPAGARVAQVPLPGPGAAGRGAAAGLAGPAGGRAVRPGGAGGCCRRPTGTSTAAWARWPT